MANDPPLQPDPHPEAHKPPLTPSRIFLRGLAVSLPAVLTIVIVIWIVQFVNDKLIEPATWTVKFVITHFVDESVSSSSLVHIDAAPPIDYCGTGYLVTSKLRQQYFQFVSNQQAQLVRREGDSEAPPDWNPIQQRRAEWMQREAQETPSEVYVPLGPKAVPYPVYAQVARRVPPGQIPTSARGVYMEYVADRKLASVVPLSVMTVSIVVILLYFMGRFVSVRIGRFMVVKFEEQVLGRLPVVRNVYGSVKQVTDFVFTENQPVEYRRVVAIQYPRKGIWSLGFVTGESMLDIAVAAGEPCVSVLIPTSPMPMTGFTINVPKSHIVDLNLTVEQAMQFCISCGVLTPPQQRLGRDVLQRYARTGALTAEDGGSPPVAMTHAGSTSKGPDGEDS